METNDPAFSSKKLSYAIPNTIRAVHLELIQMQEELHTYLCLHSGPIPESKDKTKQVPIQLTIDGILHHASAYRRAGGERLQLEPEAQQLLLNALLAQKSVQIQFTGYKLKIDPESFQDFFEKMEKKSILAPIERLGKFKFGPESLGL